MKREESTACVKPNHSWKRKRVAWQLSQLDVNEGHTVLIVRDLCTYIYVCMHIGFFFLCYTELLFYSSSVLLAFFFFEILLSDESSRLIQC